MTARGDILIIAPTGPGADLASRLGPRAVLHRDPYDALLDLGQHEWSAVVLSAPQPELPGLARATRRLAHSAPLYACCPVSGEPEVLPLAQGLIDDYFIYPPTRQELSRLLGGSPAAAGAAPAPAPAAPTPPPADAAPQAVLPLLLDAARSPGELENAVVALLERHGLAARWYDADRAPAHAQTLLALSADQPRVLVAPAGAGSSAAVEALSGQLREILPALASLARRCEALHRLAITDHLTGAYNRRYFYHLCDQVLLRAAQHHLRASVLLFDIDDFKRYNDTYGHAAGDEILREIAKLMKKVTRSHDVVARIGGDEFAILFWDPDQPRRPDSLPPTSAFVLADRFRRAVARHEFPSLGPEATGVLTISGGLASYPEGTTTRDLLRHADQALRQAKTAGKNAIRIVG